MGTEMLMKASDSFARKQRSCLDAFEEQTLFSSLPQLSLVVLATPAQGHEFVMNEHYRLSEVDGRIAVIKGITIVGRIDDPPASVVDTMRGLCPSILSTTIGVSSVDGKAELLLE